MFGQNGAVQTQRSAHFGRRFIRGGNAKFVPLNSFFVLAASSMKDCVFGNKPRDCIGVNQRLITARLGPALPRVNTVQPFSVRASDTGATAIVIPWLSLRASLSGTFLQTLPDLVTPLNGHSLSSRSCPPTRSAPSERSGY